MINQNLFEKSAVFSTFAIVVVEKNRLFKEILLFMRFITILYFACQKFWFCLSNNICRKQNQSMLKCSQTLRSSKHAVMRAKIRLFGF